MTEGEEERRIEEKIFLVALSHGRGLRSGRLSEFWLRKFLLGVGIGLESSHITGVTDVFLENLWNQLKSDEDEHIGLAEFEELLGKIAVRRQQAAKMAERKRCQESEKVAILSSGPNAVEEQESLDQFIIRNVEPYLEASCGPGEDVMLVEKNEWAPLTQQIILHAEAFLFDTLFLPLFNSVAQNGVVTLEGFERALLRVVGRAAFSPSEQELLQACFDESNLYDTRGMTTGHISEELELDEFVDGVVLFGIRSKAQDRHLVTIQAKAWAFLEEACQREGIDPPRDILSETDVAKPKPRLCLTFPEVVPIAEFGCFLVAGIFFPDISAEQDAASRRSHIDNASKLVGPSREDRRRTMELALRLHSDRFGRRFSQTAASKFFISVDNVQARLDSTRRSNRYRVQVPAEVKQSGFRPLCSASLMEDGSMSIITRQLKSVLVGTSEPSSPTDRVLLERRVSTQVLSRALTATMELRFRALAKDPDFGLTEDEFLIWYEQVKAAPRSFSLAQFVKELQPTALSTLFHCYAAAKGQCVTISVGRDGWYDVSRHPAASGADSPPLGVGMTFANTVAATWLAFLSSQADIVPSAERFFDLSFDKLGAAMTPHLPTVALPAVGNLVIEPYKRALRQRDVARSSAIKEHEATKVRFDYAHPEPMLHDHEEETPLALAEKHGTISTSKEALRLKVRTVSESLKQDYFAQQMVRLL